MKGLELKELHCDEFQRNINLWSWSDYALQTDNPKKMLYFNDLLFNSAVGSDASEHSPYKA